MRCGACNEVFDGNAALVEPLPKPVLATPPAPVSMPDPAVAAAPAPVPAATPFDEKMAAIDTRAATALQPDTAEPIYTLDLDDIDTGADDPVAPADIAPPAERAPFPAASAPLAADDAAPHFPPAPGDALDLDLSDIEPEHMPAPAAGHAGIEPAYAPVPVAEHADIEPAHAPAPALEQAPAPSSPLDPLLEQPPVTEAELAETLAAEVARRLADESAGEPDAPAPDDISDDGRREPTFGEPPSEHLVASALADGHHPRYNELEEQDEEALVLLSAAAIAHTRPAPHPDAGLHALALAAEEDAAPAEEPGFVRRDRLRSQWRKASSVVMGLGSVLLLAALLGQVVSTFRNPLAAQVPALKPALQTACVALGCRVELPSQIDYVTIEQGELQTLNESTFSFTTLLRNQGRTAQNWPHIELILDDGSDKAVLRRVFSPRDYLGPAADIARGFGPHTEQSVKLYFELAQLKASGYHIAVFYP